VASRYLIGRVGGEALGAALAVNRSMRRLLLPGNALGDRGVAAVARAITTSCVTYLDLSHNGVSGVGGMAVVRALQGGLQLRTLDLSYNPLFNAVPALARQLERQKTLTDLNLAATDMTNAGADAVATLLMVRGPTLCALSLADNAQVTAAWRRVFDALEGEELGLLSLDVSGNRLRLDATDALFTALQPNTRLTSLNLKDTRLQPAAVSRLAELLRENATLQTVTVDPETCNALREVPLPHPSPLVTSPQPSTEAV
jgi:Ran GTPase-activating protein (RanGAP) involved in mRNA processing and transport